MIGNRGEVYDIKKEKFDNSYYITDEKLDIFTSMMDFIPTVETMSDGCDEKQCLSIDEMAKICYPKTGINIYAKELKNRTKVFGVSNREDYYIGHQGDYMAVRTDDVSDAYIIKRDIFHITYEKSS
jgi:phosphoglycolate phosphatase